MTSPDDLERRLTARLDERAAPRAPEGLSKAIDRRVDRAAQRPAWATTERWISMETRAQFGALPRAVIVFATLALLTLITATAIAIGANVPPKLPPPFGPAGNGLIAFASEGDIWVVEPDGSDLRQLTSGPEHDDGPTWSRDGSTLAFWSGPGEDEAFDLVVTDAQGADPTVIATAPGEVTGEAWSADGTEYMFSAVVPELVPDQCLNVSGNACGSRLFVAATDGSGVRQVGDPDLDARGPALSPDGDTVAFGGGLAANEHPYLMDWDGSSVRVFGSEMTGGGGWAFAQHSWHPDGRTLVTHDGLLQTVWAVRFDEAGEAVEAEKLKDYAFWPVYSADGTGIRWQVNVGGVEIYDPASGTSSDRIPGREYVAWAPDGTRLVGTGGSEVVTFDRSGGDMAVVATVSAGAVAWQRVAE